MNITLSRNTFKLTFLFILIAMPLFLKMWHVDNFIYAYTGTRLFGAAQIIKNDAIIYAMVTLLFYLSYISKVPHLISILLRLFSFFIVLLYAIDFYVITNFNTHLVIADAIKYSSYGAKYIQQISTGKGLILTLIILGAGFYAIKLIFGKQKVENSSIHKYSITVILGMLLISRFSTAGSDEYVHAWIYKNLFDYNQMVLSEGRPYSNEFIRQLDTSEKQICYANTAITPNIIILMMESLSSYQSSYFSGIKNWTPNLDSIAKRNRAYTNFYANGFTTEDGEISLLTGLLPIYKPSSHTRGGGSSFKGFFGVDTSLPNILKQQEYKVEFLTTADLSFANTKNWAASVGFDYIEGSEHPYYNTWEKFHFDSAPDEALYNRVLDRVAVNSDKHNFFLFIKTVSTHHPFVNPDNMNKSEKEVFEYADKQLGIFYKKLVDTDYFNNGLLIIVGDHHAMIPLKKEEIELFGARNAAARVPMLISHGDKNQSTVTTQHQQTDIYNYLTAITSSTQCYSDWQGNILGKKPAKYIAHRRGDNRNIISIFSHGKEYSVLLDGDNTRITSDENLDKETNRAIIDKINGVRLPHNHK